MALDTNGNPTVDFAWGNFPMQPDTERGPVEVVTRDAFSYDDAATYGLPAGAFVISNISVTDTILPGYTVDITNNAGTTVLISGTVKQAILQGTLTGLLLNEAYLPANNTIFDNNNFPAGGPKVNVYPALNVGGGAGDKNWSKTTAVKSDVLDLDLDGHIITKGWNGYPGYVPNVTSVSIFDGILPAYLDSSPNGAYGTRIIFEYQDSYSTPGASEGYLIKVYEPSNSDVSVALAGLFEDDLIIGKSVDSIPVSLTGWAGSSYISADLNLPAGTVVGGSTYTDEYNNTTTTITVYTGAFDKGDLTGYTYSTIFDLTQEAPLLLGAGDNKEIVYKGIVGPAEYGDDFVQALLNPYGDVYAGISTEFVELTGASYPGAPAPSAKTLALASADLNNALLGFGNVSRYDSEGETLSKFAVKLTDGVLGNDGYGNMTHVRLVTTVPTGMSMGFYEYRTGTILYIVK